MCGEPVINFVARTVPPGMLGRVVGVQNIKGISLDFVYRWLAWEVVHAACVSLIADDPRAVEQGRQTLSARRLLLFGSSPHFQRSASGAIDDYDEYTG